MIYQILLTGFTAGLIFAFSFIKIIEILLILFTTTSYYDVISKYWKVILLLILIIITSVYYSIDIHTYFNSILNSKYLIHTVISFIAGICISTYLIDTKD